MENEQEGWITGFACCRVCNLECPKCHSMSGELTE